MSVRFKDIPRHYAIKGEWLIDLTHSSFANGMSHRHMACADEIVKALEREQLAVFNAKTGQSAGSMTLIDFVRKFGVMDMRVRKGDPIWHEAIFGPRL